MMEIKAMKLGNANTFNVGDVVKLKRDRCGCCIDPRSDIGSADSWPQYFQGTILDKYNGLIRVGFTASDSRPIGSGILQEQEKKFGCECSIYLGYNTVCELIAAAKTSVTSSNSLGFLFACIGVGAGISHYTCMQRNSPKGIEMTLTK